VQFIVVVCGLLGTEILINGDKTMRYNIILSILLALSGSVVQAKCGGLLDHEFRYLAGKEKVRLCEKYADQVVLVVNTASKCGYTKQYEGLEKLHAELKPKGFSVLGFPSNDFMGQEPGSEKEIQEFCTLTYGVKFPMFEKTTVKGDSAHPFYKALTAAADNAPDWNFHKYLIDRNGKFIATFGPGTKPDDEKLRAAIELALKPTAAKQKK
jgi:glutathione peroxidase